MLCIEDLPIVKIIAAILGFLLVVVLIVAVLLYRFVHIRECKNS